MDRYYGTYDLYDLEGTMVIGGFNNCQIGTNYFILNFGIVVKSYWKTTYWGNTEIECGDELVKELNCDKMYSIIVDKDLKSFIPAPRDTKIPQSRQPAFVSIFRIKSP